MRLALLAACSLTPAAALAQGETLNEGQVQEYFLGDDATTNQRSELQSSAGLDVVPGPDGDDYQVPVSAEFGLTDRLQLEAEADIATSDTMELDGVEANAAYSFLSSKDAGFALTGGVGVLGERDALGMRPGVAPFLRAYKNLGPVGLNVQLRAEGMPASGGRDSELQPDLSAGAALGVGILRPMVEAAYRDEQGQTTRMLAPGLLLHPSDTIEFGVSAPARWMEDGGRSLGVMAMLTLQAGGKD
jgi:hypothetical protein